MNRGKAADLLTMTVSLAGALVLGSLVFYTLNNDSGHCGFDPYVALIVFVPVAISGLVRLIFGRGEGSAVLWGTVALIVGLAGIALLVYFDRSGTLVEYERWLKSGMSG